MNKAVAKAAVIGIVVALMSLAGILPGQAAITGVTGTQFNLVAREGYVSAADGGSLYSWGYALGAGLMQYPGPTLIVNQGATRGDAYATATLDAPLGPTLTQLVTSFPVVRNGAAQ